MSAVSPLTLYLARFFSVGCLLMCAAMAARPAKSLSAINSVMQSEGIVLSLGVITLAAGVATIIGHGLWNGVLAIFVTAMGWLMVIKGLALMVLTKGELARLYKGLGCQNAFVPLMAGMTLVSAVFVVLSFTAA